MLPLVVMFVLPIPPPPRSTLFPYTTLFRSKEQIGLHNEMARRVQDDVERRNPDFAEPSFADMRNQRKAEIQHRRLVRRQRTVGHAQDSINQLGWFERFRRLQIFFSRHKRILYSSQLSHISLPD